MFHSLPIEVKNGFGHRVSSKGQVTIPKPVREVLGVQLGGEVEFLVEGNVVTIRRSTSLNGRSRGQRMVEALRGTKTANLDMTTDEIMQLLRDDD